ncbi:hypothetical protein [Sulfobacillus thermosulfidooxidans]|uniref:hypothetical protein n=1 Tax=Sulfobacillus thermosulfidooxidans TaxID=28034 RepID=UPI000594140D|nr:hypothetical protein [Sulfobacillus thermosulfidooxidans]
MDQQFSWIVVYDGHKMLIKDKETRAMPVLYRVHLIDNPSELVNIRWNEEGQITQIEPYQQLPGNVPSLWDKDRDLSNGEA